jgi:hypothetical protein
LTYKRAVLPVVSCFKKETGPLLDVEGLSMSDKEMMDGKQKE